MRKEKLYEQKSIQTLGMFLAQTNGDEEEEGSDEDECRRRERRLCGWAPRRRKAVLWMSAEEDEGCVEDERRGER
ncbi:uncharacterized protein DS421_1g28110 [Arachis hypogaea]|nr:uncharacterized protein DS421_1g28110 [Arachis hypogaea]